MDLLKSDSPLIIYPDVKSPSAFVDDTPNLTLQRELGFTFYYRPYTLDLTSCLDSARKENRAVIEPSGWSHIMRNAIYRLPRHSTTCKITGLYA